MPDAPRLFRGALLLIVASIAIPTPIAAQNRATGSVGAEVRFSPVAGATRLLVGAELWLGIGDDFRFGGGAWALPSASRSGTLAGSGLELDFGYGGIGVEWSGLPVQGLASRLLVGAGSGTAIDRATGSRVDSEGFFLVEPTLDLSIPIASSLSVTAEAGWRFTFGLDGLTRVDPDDLDAWVLGVGLRFGSF